MHDSCCEICPENDHSLEQFICESKEEVSHHRMINQEVKCGYGLSGLCCKLCSNGPCRVSPKRPKGVCGADADTIVMRNFLRSVAAGSGCYLHIIENTAKCLKKVATEHREILGVDTLHELCGRFGISESDDWNNAAILAQTILDDLNLPIDMPMVLMDKIAYPKRLNKWNELGIHPGGGKDEILNAIVKTSTNLNSDPIDMAMHCLRLGISTGIYGLTLNNWLNDIIFGEPEIGFASTGFGVINPACINIMITGHQESKFINLINSLEQNGIRKLAKQVGAKDIQIVGCTCVGQEFELRSSHCRNSFCGHAGNNFSSEALLMTDCIDLVVSEFNCTLPGIESICDSKRIPIVCLDDVAKKKNAVLLSSDYQDKDQTTATILSMAISSFKNRLTCGQRKNPLAGHGCFSNVLIGLTDKTLSTTLGGSWKPLIDAIVNGTIRGVAAVVGCSNLRAKGHDVFTVNLVKKLIANDILVLSAGCTSGGLENCGMMCLNAAEQAGDGLKSVCRTIGVPPVLNFGPCLSIGRIELVAAQLAKALNVDLPQLPVVISAPQWLEEQALADGIYALTLGFPLHLGLPPFVGGSEKVVELFTETMKNLTDGYLLIDTDVASTAQALESIIEEKRMGLGLDD